MTTLDTLRRDPRVAMNATTLAKYPAHTRTWLMMIDAAVTDRAKMVRVPKIAAANSYLNHATGNAAYFARLYVELLEKAAQSWKGYATHADRLGVEVLTDYETGANDTLATLKQIAEEALS